MTTRQPIRSVAVLGAGLTGLSAAIAFARLLPGVGVLLVETPVDPAAVADRLPAILPVALAFLDRLGLDPDALVAAGVATHRTATRYVGWRADGADAVHAFGGRDGPSGNVHRSWAALVRDGVTVPFHRYLTGGAAADRERLDFVANAPAASFALRLDPDRARSFFIQAAQHVGVRLARGRIVGVAQREDGGIAAVLLDDDRRASADLFVDATGSVATLASLLDPALGSAAFDDWSAMLPETRLMLSRTAAMPPTPVDRVTKTATGWRAEWPLADHHLIGVACGTDEEPHTRAAPGTKAETVVLRPGRRQEPWRRNILALGDAAACPGALEWTGLSLAHAALELALELLPGRDMHPLELAEYNRRWRLRTDRVRDFLALLHPAGPAHASHSTVMHFARRGLLPHHEEESFERDSWLTMLLGLGVVPQRADPLPRVHDAVSLAALAARFEAAAERAPPYPDLLRRLQEARR